MALVLKGPARGPDGDYASEGRPVPDTWPDWFIEDLKTLDQVEDRPGWVSDTEIAEAAEQVALDGVNDRSREST